MKINRIRRCIDCGKKFTYWTKSMRCRKCYCIYSIGKNSPGYKCGKIKTKCDTCNNILLRIPYHIKHNKNNFCNRKCMGIWHSKNIYGKKHHLYSQVITRCITCNKIISINLYRFKNTKLHFCNQKCFGVWVSNNKSGKKSPHYIDGRSLLKYPSEFNDKLRLEIRTRDNFECQNCHMTEEEHIIVIGKVLSPHHIDYDKFNNLKTNLITLCSWCNSRANKNRKFWQEYYTKKINQYKHEKNKI